MFAGCGNGLLFCLDDSITDGAVSNQIVGTVRAAGGFYSVFLPGSFGMDTRFSQFLRVGILTLGAGVGLCALRHAGGFQGYFGVVIVAITFQDLGLKIVAAVTITALFTVDGAGGSVGGHPGTHAVAERIGFFGFEVVAVFAILAFNALCGTTRGSYLDPLAHFMILHASCLSTGMSCVTIVTLCGLCTVCGAGGIVIGLVLSEAVIQLAVGIFLGLLFLTAVTLGSFRAVGGAGGVAVAYKVGEAVTQLGVRISNGILGSTVVVAKCALGAILGAGGIVVADVIAIAVGQLGALCGDLIGSSFTHITVSRLGAIGKAGGIVIVDIIREGVGLQLDTCCISGIRCVAAVTLGSFRAFIGAGHVSVGEIVGKAVAQSRSCVGNGACFAAVVVTFCGLGAVSHTSCVAIADVVGEAMAKSAARIGDSVRIITPDTLGSLGAVLQAGGIVVAEVLAVVKADLNRSACFFGSFKSIKVFLTDLTIGPFLCTMNVIMLKRRDIL